MVWVFKLAVDIYSISFTFAIQVIINLKGIRDRKAQALGKTEI